MKKLLLTLAGVTMALASNATIYVVGAGEGLSWDLPGKAYEAGTDGKYVLEINNLTSFKFSTNYSTEWDGDGSFNAGAYATGSDTFDNSVYPNGQTLPIVSWGDNQSVPYKANYKITIDLSANTMTAQTSTPPSNEAPAVYIRGAVNGWNSFTSEWQFTNKTWTGTSGVYEWTGTIPAGSAFKIADDAWGQINYTTNNTGMVPSDSPVTLTYNSGDMSFASAFTGTITLNISNYLGHVATATFATSGEVVPPTYPSAIYCIGDLKDCGWDPTKGLKMNSTGTGVYSAEVELTGSYFAFATQLSSNSSDWGGLGTRYGATSENEPVVLDQNMTIAVTGSNYSFMLDPGTYEITVSLADMTMLVKRTASFTYPTTMYVLGNVNGQDWSPTNGVLMQNIGEGKYEVKNLAIGNAGDNTGRFSFTVSLSSSADNWDGLGTRYGAIEDNYNVADNGNYKVMAGQNAFLVGGDVTLDLVLDLVSMNITISNYNGEVNPNPNPNPDGPVTASTIYLVGAGDGLGWDLPGKEISGTNNVFTFTVNNLSKFKISTKNATEWDAFNEGAYSTGDNTFSASGVYPAGETLPIMSWGEDQMLPYTGTYTITVDFNEMKMTAKAETPAPEGAPDVYLRGDMNNWLDDGMTDTWKLNYNSATDSYEFNCSGRTVIPANTDFKIADSTWGNINYGYGPVVLSESGATNVDLIFNADNISLSKDFTGTLTFKITANQKSATATFAPSGSSSVETLEVVEGEAVYFNLQGQKVTNPEKGIFVKVLNGKAEKVVK